MDLLIAGLVMMIGIHLVPAVVPVRSGLIKRMGETAYKAVFSVVALAGLVLIIYGKSRAEFVALWNPPVWGHYVTMVLMPFSILLLAAANMPSNIKRITPNPMLWGILLWSVAHLFANGDKASLLLFGCFGLYAVVGLITVNRRGQAIRQEKLHMSKDVILIVASIIGVVALSAFHGQLFGVAIM